MRPTSPAQVSQILTLLDSGHSTHQIQSLIGINAATVSRLRQKHRPTLAKSRGGRPLKLSQANIRHGVRLLTSGKAETAVQVAEALSKINGQPVSAKTVSRRLKSAGVYPKKKGKKLA